MDGPRQAGHEAGRPGPIKDKKVKEELKAKYWPMIDDGIENLEKALQLDPEYDDAMAYVNLLFRERADLVDTPEEYKKEIDDGRQLGPEGPGNQEDQGRAQAQPAAASRTEAQQ